MSLSSYIADIFLPIIDFIFSMFDQCFQLFFNLKLMGVSFGGLMFLLFFVKFLFSKIFDIDLTDDGEMQDIINENENERLKVESEKNIVHTSYIGKPKVQKQKKNFSVAFIGLDKNGNSVLVYPKGNNDNKSNFQKRDYTKSQLAKFGNNEKNSKYEV